MNTTELERQLTDCILVILRERAYDPSPSCDPAIRDPYFAAAVQAIMEHQGRRLAAYAARELTAR